MHTRLGRRYQFPCSPRGDVVSKSQRFGSIYATEVRDAHRQGHAACCSGLPEFPPSYGDFRAAKERYLESTRVQAGQHLAELAIRDVFPHVPSPAGDARAR